MHKLKIALIVMVVLFSVGLTAQSITVTSPNGGENLVMGHRYDITWNTTGITSGTYQVTVWRGDSNLGVVATGLPAGQHSFSWTVGDLARGGEIPAGSGYTIKVRLQGEEANDFSDRPFTIVARAPSAAITVTRPNGGESWARGSRQDINWNTTGITTGTYQVTVWRGDSNLGVVASGLPAGQHSFSWTVGRLDSGEDVPVGTGYTIKVRLQEETANDFSDRPFAITQSEFATGTLIPLTPADYAVESLDFRDFNGRNVFQVNGVWEFPYSGDRTQGAAVVQVRRRPGLQVGVCRPQLVVALRVLSRRGPAETNQYPLEFNADNIAEVRAPFTVPAGLRGDSDINVQAYLAPMPDGCDRVRTNNSRACNLNLHLIPGSHDLIARIDNFEVKKIYMSSHYRWRFSFRIGVQDQGAGELRNVGVNWRLLEDGTNEVYSDTLSIARLEPGEWQHLNVDRRFGGTDKRSSQRPRLRAGHRYLVEVMVDPGDQIDENQESNNRFSRSVTLPD